MSLDAYVCYYTLYYHMGLFCKQKLSGEGADFILVLKINLPEILVHLRSFLPYYPHVLVNKYRMKLPTVLNLDRSVRTFRLKRVSHVISGFLIPLRISARNNFL